jgi:[acyl-carrier-protein] S-malonyltransferase
MVSRPRPGEDTADVQAWVFPGQGSQQVGMGLDLYQSFPVARRVFQEADEALGLPLSRLCFEGPEDTLRQTINAQPAIMTVSLACLQAALEAGCLQERTAAFMAGHSLGEYTALVAAGTLTFADGLRLVRERGRLMQEAGERVPGATHEAVEHAIEEAKARGARQAIRLNVSGAFHSSLMRPAAEGMAAAVARTLFADAQPPIVANSTAQAMTSAEAIRRELLEQFRRPVLWQRSVEYMIENGVTTFVEIGPGRVLTALIRRIDGNANTKNIGDAPSIRREAECGDRSDQ